MKSFFRVFFIIFIPIMIVSYFSFYYASKRFDNLTKEKIINEMETNLMIVSNYLDLNHLDFDTYRKLKKLYDNSLIRVTVIDKNTGKVLLDNGIKYEDTLKLDNHLTRPEVKDAINEGSGYYIRYSNTIKKSLIYYAKIFDDKIVRIAYPEYFLKDFAKEYKYLLTEFMVILVIVIILVAIYLGKMVSVPVQKLNYIVDNIQAGKTNIHFPNFKDPTMSKVSSLIYTIYHLMLNKQKELNDSQTRMNFIFSVMDESILLLDKNCNLLYLNKSAKKIFKIEKSSDNIFNLTSDSDTLAFLKKIIDVIDKNTLIEKYKHSSLEIHIKIFDEYKLFIIKDITEKLDYETFKTELVGNISHELKTPVSMIMGYAETLQDNSNLEKEVAEKFINKIYDSSVRLNNLIDDIIKLHKLEQLGKDFEVTLPIVLSEFKDDILDYYSNCPKKILANFPGDNVFIEYEHLLSIVTNLIDNAIKYSLGDEIELELIKEGNEIVVRVSDLGPVIPANERERIFERFYTSSKSRNKMNAGTGLGLSIVKHIASLYGGSVRHYKNKKFGNTFEVILFERK